jgi:hypothetical protein
MTVYAPVGQGEISGYSSESNYETYQYTPPMYMGLPLQFTDKNVYYKCMESLGYRYRWVSYQDSGSTGGVPGKCIYPEDAACQGQAVGEGKGKPSSSQRVKDDPCDTYPYLYLMIPFVNDHLKSPPSDYVKCPPSRW